MEKLVRDKIPMMANERGDTRYKFRITTSDAEYKAFLYKKLQEEVDEFLKDEDPLELVDIAEVVNTILEFKKISDVKFAEMYTGKHQERGGFNNRVVMSIDGA